MSSIRLTVRLRTSIAEKIINHAFEKRIETAKNILNDYGDKIYDSLYSKEIKALMAQLPSNAFRRCATVSFYFNGYRSANMSVERPMFDSQPRVASDNKEFAALVEQYLAAYEAYSALATERRLEYNRVLTILNKVSTTSKLIEVWPEIKVFVESCAKIAEPTSFLPAIQFDELNKKLELPPTV